MSKGTAAGGVWTVDDLAAGEQVTATVTVKVVASYVAPANAVDLVTVKGDTKPRETGGTCVANDDVTEMGSGVGSPRL